jgi:hypothetical protein
MEALARQFELLDMEDLGTTEIQVDVDKRGQSGHMGCNACIHPTCRHALTFTAVCACPDEHCDGVLVLDVNSKPHWKVACNTCSLIIRFKGTASTTTVTNPVAAATALSSTAGKHASGGRSNANKGGTSAAVTVDTTNNASTMIHNITVNTSAHCAECGDRLVTLELHRDYRGMLYTAALQQQDEHKQSANAQRQGEEGVVYEGCLICDAKLQSHIDMIAGRAVSLVVLRQQRERRKRMGGRGGRGRGRGRGGGGRGGKRMTKDQILMSFSDF